MLARPGAGPDLRPPAPAPLPRGVTGSHENRYLIDSGETARPVRAAS
jgi:hypothetical protein